MNNIQVFLNGQIATAEQLAEIEAVKDSTDLQDGDFLVINQGKNLLDSTVFFSEEALMFMVHVYENQDAECYSIDDLASIDSADYTQTATHYFYDLAAVKAFYAEYAQANNSIFAYGQ